MKRLLILILFVCSLVVASSLYAFDPLLVFSGQGGGNVGGGVNYLLWWDGDECTGNSRTDAKSIGGTCGEETGTLTGATIINTDEANYYLNLDANDERLSFDLGGTEGWDEDEFYVKLITKFTTTTGDNNIFELYTDINNNFEIHWNNTNNEVWVMHKGGGTLIRNYLDDNSVEQPVDGYYCVVEAKVSAANDVLYGRVCSTADADCLECSGTEPWDTTLDDGGPDIPVYSGASTLRFGELSMGSITDPTHLTEFEVRTYANAE